MKKNAFTLPEVSLILVALLTITAVFFPTFERARRNAKYKPRCIGNLKDIGFCAVMYAQDYDDKYPLVTLGQQGWVELLTDYAYADNARDSRIFQCPAMSSTSVQGTTDYFYNAHLSGQPQNKLPFANTTIKFGDGLHAAPLYSSLKRLPPTWRRDKQSPAWRHRDDQEYTYAMQQARKKFLKGANYYFADGHVQWLPPERVSDAKASRFNISLAPW